MKKNNKNLKLYKNLLFAIILAILIIINANFICPESSKNETDYSKEFGFKENTITASGIKFEKTAEGYVFKFIDKNAYLNINGNRFENIRVYEYPSEIELDKKGRILRADFEVNDKGGKYNFDGTEFYAPPNSVVKYDRNEAGIGKKGVNIVVPTGSEIKAPVINGEEGIRIRFKTVPFERISMDENLISGTVCFNEKGEAVLEPHGMIEVNGVRSIGSYKDNEPDVSLFFDEQKHDGDSLSFGKKYLYANLVNTEVEITFLVDNPYMKIDRGDIVEFTVGKNSGISVQNRDEIWGSEDEKGLIPRVTTKGNNIKINEDAKSIYTSGENINIRSIFTRYYSSSTTSPIDLTMLKSDGSDFLGVFTGDTKISGYKLFVDNFNRIAIAPEGMEESISASEGVDTKFSARITYNYPSDDEIGLLIGKDINLHDIDKSNSDLVLGRLRDYWNTLNDDTKASIGDFDFYSYIRFEQKYPSFDAVTDGVTGDISFKAGNLFGLEEFSHEAAHALQIKIRQDYMEEDPELKSIDDSLNELKGEYKESIEKYYKMLDSGSSPGSEELKKSILENLRRQGELMNAEEKIIGESVSFEKEWNKIAGPYDKIDPNNNGEYKDYLKMSISERDKLVGEKGKEWMYRPRLGYTRPYGGQNILEDVATFVEKSNEPGFFKTLINPQSPDYDPVYRQKLDLLQKYGFISESRYQKIISLAGVK